MLVYEIALNFMYKDHQTQVYVSFFIAILICELYVIWDCSIHGEWLNMYENLLWFNFKNISSSIIHFQSYLSVVLTRFKLPRFGCMKTTK